MFERGHINLFVLFHILQLLRFTVVGLQFTVVGAWEREFLTSDLRPLISDHLPLYPQHQAVKSTADSKKADQIAGHKEFTF